MDGVLCNFLKGISDLTGEDLKTHADWTAKKDFYWEKVAAGGKEFWSNLEWCEGAQILWQNVQALNPTILSAYPSREELQFTGVYGKRIWLYRNISMDVSQKAIICAVVNKQTFAKPGDVLIDDNELTIDQWNAKGGIGILHINVEDTIRELAKVL